MTERAPTYSTCGRLPAPPRLLHSSIRSERPQSQAYKRVSDFQKEQASLLIIANIANITISQHDCCFML